MNTRALYFSNYFSHQLDFNLGYKQRLRLYALSFVMLATCILFTHQFTPIPLDGLSLTLHTFSVSLAYLIALIILGEGLRHYIQKRGKKNIQIRVHQVWLLSFFCFLTGFLLVPAMILGKDIQFIHPELSAATPYSTFMKFVPVWGLFTFLFIQAHSIKRLQKRLDRLKSASQIQITNPENTPQTSASTNDRFIYIKEQSQHSIAFTGILYIRVEDHYCYLFHLKQNTVTKTAIHMSLKQALTQLPRTQFLHVHRAYVVNLFYISKMEKKNRFYELSLAMICEKIPMSRQRATELAPKIQASLKNSC